MDNLPKNLTHEVFISLEEGHVCPSCQESRLEKVETTLSCTGCSRAFPMVTQRWRKRFPGTPEAHGYNVFASLVKLDDNGNTYVEFAADVDTGSLEDANTVYQKLVDVAGPCVEVYSSGSKGYHVQIPFNAFAYTHPGWPHVFKRLAEHLDILSLIDTSIYQPRGMLRVPGSVNPKTGNLKKLITPAQTSFPNSEFNELLAQFETEAQTTIEHHKTSDVFELLRTFTPPCIEKLWLEGLPGPGTRHQCYLHLASFYYRRGDTPESTNILMSSFAEEFEANTSMPDHRRVSEAERITSSAYRDGLGFSCSRAQAIGLCEETCLLFK